MQLLCFLLTALKKSILECCHTHACMHRHSHKHTISFPSRTYTHGHKWHLDQPNLTRKIRHALQLWDGYWFLVHRLIDLAFLGLQIDCDSRGFLMGLNLGVCLAVSKGLSVLCALITHNCLSPAACSIWWICTERLRRDKGRDFSKRQRPVVPWSELWAWIIGVYDMIVPNLVKYSMLFAQQTH